MVSIVFPISFPGTLATFPFPICAVLG